MAEYREPEGWNEPEECKPRLDADGDALNCTECTEVHCDHNQLEYDINDDNFDPYDNSEDERSSRLRHDDELSA